ncbi:MAG: hypothetical protein ACNI3C_09790 [Candidatus Marinarcus sp.]|uniref:hypothetical protein n=1 Tax=Candidatus Marinarcus sp. TaxID=3100987 RepID=UPI003AFFCF68
MNIVTFCDIDKGLLDSKNTLEVFGQGHTGEANVVILDINSIFDYEENKADACADEFVSIAIIDDESDYDAFKNFGIDAWIKRRDIDKLNEIVDLVQQRL